MITLTRVSGFDRLVTFLAILIPSVILHEVSHGVVALAFGDDTAKRAGRITLNPVSHVDPLGTLILPAILSLTSLGAFGYAKPVPVNVRRLRNPRQHSLYVSLVGPITNIALAAIATIALRSTDIIKFEGFVVAAKWSFVYWAYWFGFLNVILAVFNLLPIPPLDGSAMIERFLPRSAWEGWLKFRQYSFGILLLIMLFFPLNRLFDPALRWWSHLL